MDKPTIKKCNNILHKIKYANIKNIKKFVKYIISSNVSIRICLYYATVASDSKTALLFMKTDLCMNRCLNILICDSIRPFKAFKYCLIRNLHLYVKNVDNDKTSLMYYYQNARNNTIENNYNCFVLMIQVLI